MEPLLLTVNEVAQELRVTRAYVYRLLKQQHLSSVKIGAARRIPRKALLAYVERLERAAAGE